MTEYVARTLKETQSQDTQSQRLLTRPPRPPARELRHGAWIEEARAGMRLRRFTTPLLLLVIVFVVLFAGSMFLFENMEVSGGLYATKIIVSSLFAVSLGFLLSVWWNATAKHQAKIKEAERIDREYREMLMSLSDSLFDIIHALSTLAANPPRSFVIATEFLLGEYVHLLQSQLRRYGDDIAGLGFDATAFLDEKVRIFDGIRERAGLAVRDMPRDLEALFIRGLALRTGQPGDAAERRQDALKRKLRTLAAEPEREPVSAR